MEPRSPLAVLFLAVSLSADEGALDPSIRPQDIQSHVNFLASDELKGRSAKSKEARTAAHYIADHFKRFGLEPLPRPESGGESYFHPLKSSEIAPNVVAALAGSGEGYVLVTAHYDHLPPKASGTDRIYNGADDNASGTAGLLEIAHAFAAREKRPSATIVFIAFTAEEMGLRGSRYFVANPPLPLEEIRGVVNLDMISRGKQNLIYCEGGEYEIMRNAADKANRRVGLNIRYDEHPEWRAQSDHSPFMKKGIPTLYFGVENHPDYHRVSDHADRILADLATRVSELTFLLVLDVAKETSAKPEEILEEGPEEG
jgi:Zn-dependent M28 family amino/carboxypeptidase